MTLVYIAAAFVPLVLVVLVRNRMMLRRLHADGLYPQAGSVTMADVERLAKSGEQILAIKAYRELHDVGLKEAKEAVEKIV